MFHNQGVTTKSCYQNCSRKLVPGAQIGRGRGAQGATAVWSRMHCHLCSSMCYSVSFFIHLFLGFGIFMDFRVLYFSDFLGHNFQNFHNTSWTAVTVLADSSRKKGNSDFPLWTPLLVEVMSVCFDRFDFCFNSFHYVLRLLSSYSKRTPPTQVWINC